MSALITSDLTVPLPPSVAATTSSHEIIELLLGRAMNKAEYFKSKSKFFQQSHGMCFNDFKAQSELQEESFSAWDDLLVWEGYELAYHEWYGKYQDLLACLK